jgi:peptidoglycan/LPS O-acetylase OafA/YrhL
MSRVRAAFSLRTNVARLVTPAPGHLGPLDGLRALSVLWVVLFHAGWYARFSLPAATWLKLVFAGWMLPIWRGDFGVDVFFVLSGFLIAGMLIDEEARTGGIGLEIFYARRLLRLWPALLFVVALELCTDDPNRDMAWANALYINNFLPVGTVALAWTWSLAIEEQFYLVCPWLILGMTGKGARQKVLLLVGVVVVLACVAARVVVTNDIRPIDSEIVVHVDMARWGLAFDAIYDKPWMRAGALLVGVITAIVYRDGHTMKTIANGGWRVTVGIAMAFALMGMATHWQLVLGSSRLVEVLYLSTFRTVFASGVGFLILVVLSQHAVGRAMGRALASRWLYPFAQLAYAAYLLNPIVAMFCDRMLASYVSPERPMLLLMPVNVVCTFACATLMHLGIERPFMELRPRSSS